MVAQEAGRARERLHGLLLLIRRAHHRDEHLGVAEIWRHLNPGDRAQKRHARILELTADQLGQAAADFIADALGATWRSHNSTSLFQATGDRRQATEEA